MIPHFLIVGAMKAGTTTLYRDLLCHPDIFMPQEKEPETLARFSELSAVRRDYASLFPASARDKIRGEASTAYTKRPIYERVAERAHELTGGDLRIVYMRRNPVERMVSHYRHEFQTRRISVPFAEALRLHPELIEFTRYDWQIEPWKQAFGDSQVLDVELEDFSANRTETVKRVLAHIGADPERLPPLDTLVVANRASEPKGIENPALKALIRSHFYQRRLKTLVPNRLRDAGRKALLPGVTPPNVEISPSTLAYIESELRGSITSNSPKVRGSRDA